MPTTTYVSMTPDGKLADASNRANATPTVLALARVLQLAAFANPEVATTRGFVGDFDPAPVYLAQATALATSEGRRRALHTALQLVAERRPTNSH